MYKIEAKTDKGILIELIYLLNQYENARIALYGSLAAANNISISADFVDFSISVSAILPIDNVAAETPIFPEWNNSILYPFYSILQFENFYILGGAFEFEMLQPTSGAFVSKLFTTDLYSVIQSIFDESDSNDGSTIPIGIVLSNSLDTNYKKYYLGLGDKNNPLGSKAKFSNGSNFRFDRFFEEWYEFSVEDGGDQNFVDWRFRVRGLPPVYQILLVPDAIVRTMRRLNFANDDSQIAELKIDSPNLKVNLEIDLKFNPNYENPLKISA